MSITDRLHELDHRQQKIRGLRFVLAVYKKFTDDQGGQLAALISYYGFVSLFPLLLVFVTILGFVLQGNPKLQDEIVKGTLGQIPLVQKTLNPPSLKGSPAALAIGIVGSLLSGMGIMSATQSAFDRIWAVPFKRRPNFIFARLRSLAMLAVLGALAIVSTVVGGFVGTGSHSALPVVGGVVLAFALNLVLFMLAFKLLTAEDLGWRTLLPGVITATVLWQLLQHLGGYYVDHELKHTKAIYGVFAIVLGLLAWLYLGARFVVLAAEVNVVKARRLWPRSFFSSPLLDADRRALTHTAEVEERLHEEDVQVRFDESRAGGSARGD
jgi:YihY family inner membrane protein